MIEVLTGAGLAASAGLNAYLPLLAVGLFSRYTPVLELPAQWAWLAQGPVLWIVAVLVVAELIVDKIPALDHINDMIQSIIRPASGGICFAAVVSATTSPGGEVDGAFSSGVVLPFIIGVVIALIVHLVKTTARSAVNAATAGLGAAVLSTIEDVGAIALIVLAVLAPGALVALVVLVAGFGLWRYQLRKDRARPAYPL